MSATQLKRIAIAFGVVLLLWGAAEIVGGHGARVRETASIPLVTAAQADTVELRRAADTLRFVKTATGAWTVNGYATEPAMIERLFRTFSEDGRSDLVARNPTSHARMGVDSASGRRLRIVGGNRTLVDLWVGQRGNVWESVFVRPQGDDRVYELRGPLASHMDQGLNDWRDKRILSVEPDSVWRVAVERGRRRYTLERADGGWRFAAAGAADSAEVARLLSGFRSLTAQGASFATDEEAARTDFARPDRRVTLLGATGDTLAALTFDSTATGFWVRRLSGGPVYHLFTWRVDELAPADSVLREDRRR